LFLAERTCTEETSGRASSSSAAEDRHLRAGLNVHRGRVTNAPVAEALGYDAFAPEAVLSVA